MPTMIIPNKKYPAPKGMLFITDQVSIFGKWITTKTLTRPTRDNEIADYNKLIDVTTQSGGSANVSLSRNNNQTIYSITTYNKKQTRRSIYYFIGR